MGRAWTVYVVRCNDGSLYTGIALDLFARIERHNLGRGARYTRTRRPVFLVYKEYGHSKSSALKRERQIKSLRKIEKEALVRSMRW